MAETRGRGQACVIYFPLIDFGATDFEDTPVVHAGGDTQFSEDGAAFGNTAANFVHEGNGIYSLALAATEVDGAHIVVTIIDQTAPKAWEDQAVLIDTGNAYPDGMVYVDDTGTASTDWPVGPSSNPTDTIARGLIIANANNLDTMSIHGDHTLVANMEGFNFIGHGHVEIAERINVAGFSVEHSTFSNLVVQGATGNAAGAADVTYYDSCALWAHTNINGIAYNSGVLGACSIRDTGYAILNDCIFGGLAACTLTLQAPTVCNIFNMRGTVTLAGMDGGVCFISLTPGAAVTIDNTCTAGTITIVGWGTVVDNSLAGCTVIWQPPPYPNRIG